jgi:CBS domain-containing protein
MTATVPPRLTETAGGLMTRDIITIRADLPLTDAGRRLAAANVRGAPVVDETGRCVGVISVTDVARWAAGLPAPGARAPRSCSYWEPAKDAAGKDVAVCKLAPGACALQRRQPGRGGETLNTCAGPHGVCVGEWQVMEPQVATGIVGEYMTPDPVTATTDTPVAKLARMMINAAVHRVIVVDESGRPVGIVSCTDVLAVVARGAIEIGA